MRYIGKEGRKEGRGDRRGREGREFIVEGETYRNSTANV